MPTRRLVLVLAVAVIAPPACAAGALVDVQVVDRTAHQVLPTYRHHGSVWIAGKPGDRYAVRLTNHSGGRVLVVLSVDGVNAVSGDSAAVGQTGYVLRPWESSEITGWRKSYTEAAAFYFTSLPDSYAARTGRPDNVGVIGAAVFRERPAVSERREPVEVAPLASDSNASRDDAAPAAAPAARSAATEAESTGRAAPSEARRKSVERLGTGHGEREYAPVSQVAFERASSEPAEIVKVRYDSYRNLVAMGVIEPAPAPLDPQPFARFVPDPR